MLLLAKQIKRIYFYKKDKSLYTNNIEKIDLFNSAEYKEKADKEQINPETIHKT